MQLQLVQLIKSVILGSEISRQEIRGVPTVPRNSALPKDAEGTFNREAQQQSRSSWANVAGVGPGNGWVTVASSKKKLKKHPRDQRRALFVRNVQPHNCDPRDIMFEVNKALAHARAPVALRLVKMHYTDKGNLTCVMSENASADELLNSAPTVMGAVRTLDPEVAYMEKP